MEKLVEGVYLFENALSLEQKQYLYSLYKDNLEYFVKPKLKNSYSMSLRMLCFGKHWNSIDYKYHDRRTEVDGMIVKEYPNDINKIAEIFSKQCFPEHTTDWDILLVNEYTKNSKLNLHKDNSERLETLDSGHPVVSFSLGASTNFNFGKTKQDIKSIDLDSGDVILFGNEARMMYHGVDYIDSFKNLDKNLVGDVRINFTLRKW